MCPITDTDVFRGRQSACGPNASGKVTKNGNFETKSHEQICKKEKEKTHLQKISIYRIARARKIVIELAENAKLII